MAYLSKNNMDGFFYYPEISENKITEYRLGNVENSCSES